MSWCLKGNQTKRKISGGLLKRGRTHFGKTPKMPSRILGAFRPERPELRFVSQAGPATFVICGRCLLVGECLRAKVAKENNISSTGSFEEPST